MIYKALMLDVDGTVIPYDYEAVPSDRLCNAIREVQKHVTVCLVTGRAYASIENILTKFSLTEGYVIVNNGAQVIDLATREIVHDQPINDDDAKQIMKILSRYEMPFYVKQDTFKDTTIGGSFKLGDAFEKAYMIFTLEEFSDEKVEQILKALSPFPEIVAHKSHHGEAGKYGFNITHVNATKLHGINIFLEKTGLSRQEIIGVGDSYNDFPLLMASGLKVAMGNAIDELKEIADFIAPTVTDDGVVDVINTFILSNLSAK